MHVPLDFFLLLFLSSDDFGSDDDEDDIAKAYQSTTQTDDKRVADHRSAQGRSGRLGRISALQQTFSRSCNRYGVAI